MGDRLRFTLFIDDKPIDEEWVGGPGGKERAEALATRQATLAREAVDAGKVIRLEVYDPDLPPESATMVLSNSSVGMTNPVTGTFRQLGPTMVDDFRRRHEAAGG